MTSLSTLSIGTAYANDLPTEPPTVGTTTSASPDTSTAIDTPASPASTAPAADASPPHSDTASTGTGSASTPDTRTTTAGNDVAAAGGSASSGSPSPAASTENPPVAQSNALTLTLRRSDEAADPTRAHIGDRITFTVSYTNNTSAPLTAYPRTSNLRAAAVEGSVGNCRWANLAPGATKTCGSAWIEITPELAATGTFMPEIVFDATRDRAGTDIIQAGLRVTLDAPITLVNTPAPPPELVEGRGIVLATPGDAGFSCHRIPALTTAPNGWLLAAWDGRPTNCADSPQANSIVQRISKDGGRTWEPIQTIAAGNTGTPRHGYSDPSYVVDRQTGTIFLFFVKSYDVGLWQSAAGVDPSQRNVLHAAVMHSTNNGQTWSEPQVITQAITNDVNTWTARFAASGEGIQKRHAPHAGRLIQQYTVNVGGIFKAVSVFSDDHGQTWQAGQPFGAGMDENKVVELADGRLMVNSRASSYGAPGVSARRVAISEDGGQSYGDVYIDHSLIDPNNNAAIIRAFPEADPGSLKSHFLLFTNTASTSGRQNGTVKLSMDDGTSWAKSKVFRTGGMQYSTITPLPTDTGSLDSGTYGILYEHPSSGISFMKISLDWLGVPKVAVSGISRDVVRGGNWLTFTVTNTGASASPAGTLTPQPIPGWEWNTASVPVPALEAGQSAEVLVKATISKYQNAASVLVSGTVSLEGDTENYTGGFRVNATLQPGQFDAHCSTDVTLIAPETIPAETTNENGAATNMLNDDLGSIWHTPWAGLPSPLPLSFDLSVPMSSTLEQLELIARPNGLNGVISSADIALVSAGGVEILASNVNPADGPISLAALHGKVADGQRAHIRVTVKATRGANAANENRFVSLARACFRLVDNAPITHDEIKPGTPAVQILDANGAPLAVSVPRGTQVTLVAPAPQGESVDFWVHSDPVNVGRGVGTSTNTAQVNWTVPEDFPLGEHQIFARDAGNNVVAYLRFSVTEAVSQPSEPTGPSTPGNTGNTSGSTGSTSGTHSQSPSKGTKATTTTRALARTGTQASAMLAAGAALAVVGLSLGATRRRRA
ncbi:exo-alpha-sialidase [Schaalia suimastitidis]|uniref:exo-alpha-sialidase n=1 Tax=Schaalia suimastitidis TaxID=121163 RepID=UPI0003F7C499|nr:exo-alpha-sialidase [Schaalia suimastitidis]